MVYERKKFTSLIIIIAAAPVVVLLYFFVYPLYGKYFPKCLFYTFTGLYCPGCGSQRALVALLHGNIFIALRDNLLAVVALPFLTYSFTILCLNTFRKKNFYPKIFYSPLFVKTILVIVITFAVIRNIPAYPFNLLAPLL